MAVLGVVSTAVFAPIIVANHLSQFCGARRWKTKLLFYKCENIEARRATTEAAPQRAVCVVQPNDETDKMQCIGAATNDENEKLHVSGSLACTESKHPNGVRGSRSGRHPASSAELKLS
jgi:hypothetical protein